MWNTLAWTRDWSLQSSCLAGSNMALNSLMFQRCLSAIEAAKANPKLP